MQPFEICVALKLWDVPGTRMEGWGREKQSVLVRQYRRATNICLTCDQSPHQISSYTACSIREFCQGGAISSQGVLLFMIY